MTLEILKLIIMACQISASNDTPFAVDKVQNKCRKQVIKCVQDTRKMNNEADRLMLCLRERSL